MCSMAACKQHCVFGFCKIIGWIKEAILLNEQGVKLPSKTKTLYKKELVVSGYFLKTLGKIKKRCQHLKIMPAYTKTNLWNG